jgi:N-formylglutamate amidohydrolase
LPPLEAVDADVYSDRIASPFEILEPAEQTVPVVFASPHSGQDYTPGFLSLSRLDPVTLRRSEDAFVDDIFAAAPGAGAPLIRAHFPRAYVDPNREAFELDPAMFEDPLPDYVTSSSARISAGLGTVARVVTSGEKIYGVKLRFEDARRRIEACHIPYHRALEALVDSTRRHFGVCLLVDCHSMPSVGGPMDSDSGHKRVDMVLGDRHGSSCAGLVTEAADRTLRELGYQVTRNVPYAGGYTTRQYGDPSEGRHALQIEINRALYMNEDKVTRGDGFDELCDRIGRLIEGLLGAARQLPAAV